MDLYRNNTGPAYPYEIPGLVSINGSSAGLSSDFYYYFYDWEIKTSPCESPLEEVIANIVETDFAQEIVNNIVYFSDSSSGATSWLWDFGDGYTSTEQHPIHVYSSKGVYNVTLTINGGSCVSDNTITIDEVNSEFNVLIIPNPATDQANVVFSNPITEELIVEFFSVDGKLIWQRKLENGADHIMIDLTNFSSAVYFVRIQSDSYNETRRILKN
jgi:PKD repeat protein